VIAAIPEDAWTYSIDNPKVREQIRGSTAVRVLGAVGQAVIRFASGPADL
jgi:hypothetical protein